MSEGMVQDASNVSRSEIPTQAPSSSEAPPRTFTQSELSGIVKREKEAAVESYKKRMESETPRETYNYQSPQYQQVDESRVRQMAESAAKEAAEKAFKNRDDEAQRTAMNSQIQNIVSEFTAKLESGKSKYQDFDKKVTSDFMQSIPHIIEKVYNFDNVADVMYDLRSNPEKIGNLYNLLAVNPQLAMERLVQLSQSLKETESATKSRLPNEPLSQLPPSQYGVGTAANGDWSVAKARAKYKG